LNSILTFVNQFCLFMKYILNSSFKSSEKQVIHFVNKFGTEGILFGDGKRNKIKLFHLNAVTINIKSFKIPNLNYNWLGLADSYYISEHLQADLTFRELVQIPDYPDHENILRQFTQFTYDLHEKGVEFLDHSPGNTLIQKVREGKYDFYLVDLNRMNFHPVMDFDSRMKNFNRLTPKIEMLAVMSAEYATLYDKTYNDIFNKMCFFTTDFQVKFHRKIARKKKLLFWRKQ